MQARDVMVRDVVTATPDTSIAELVETLLAKHISAVPVVDGDGKLVGIVSEGDLIRRAETGTERRRSRWLTLLMPGQTLAAEYTKSHARRVGDVMTPRVVTAAPDTSLRDVAALLEKNGIKRVPIVDDGKLVGLVSRSNLLQALASATREMAVPHIEDNALREQVMARLRSEPWASTSLLNVIVQDGKVDLWGIVDSEAEKNAIRVAAEITPGVTAVNDNVVVRPVVSGT